MKNEFNLRSLASALLDDVLTSPKRIHNAYKETFATYFQVEPGDRIGAFFDHICAATTQAMTIVLGAGIGAAAAATTGSAALMYAGLAGGAALLNPLTAKIMMKYFEFCGTGLDKSLNAMGGEQKPVRQFPGFEAFPELSKALRGSQQQPQ